MADQPRQAILFTGGGWQRTNRFHPGGMPSTAHPTLSQNVSNDQFANHVDTPGDTPSKLAILPKPGPGPSEDLKAHMAATKMREEKRAKSGGLRDWNDMSEDEQAYAKSRTHEEGKPVLPKGNKGWVNPLPD